MNFRIRLSLNELESRETPSGTDPLDPNGGPPTPTTPAQTSPPSQPVTPPLDPHGR